jgi:hypothetical protein
MAKKRRTIKQRRVDVTVGAGGLRVLPFEDDGRVVVETTRGVEVECLPVADALDAQAENIRAGIEWPEEPTRTIRDVAGSEMTEPLTEAYIGSGQATDEEKEAWAEYQIAQAEAQSQFSERLNEGRVRFIAVKGVRWDDELEKTWTEDAEWLGMTVPDDSRERALHFFRSEVLGNIGDLYTILLAIYRASGYDEEVLDAVEASFRSEVGQPDEGPDAGGGEGDPGPQGRTGLVGEPPVDDGGSGAEVGPDA